VADNSDPQADLVKRAPLAFNGWSHLRGALSVGLPASLRNTDRLCRSVFRRLGR
jgi:hypothetical protein